MSLNCWQAFVLTPSIQPSRWCQFLLAMGIKRKGGTKPTLHWTNVITTSKPYQPSVFIHLWLIDLSRTHRWRTALCKAFSNAAPARLLVLAFGLTIKAEAGRPLSFASYIAVRLERRNLHASARLKKQNYVQYLLKVKNKSFSQADTWESEPTRSQPTRLLFFAAFIKVSISSIGIN